MLNVTHKELNELIKEYYKHKISLLVYGRFGIGKSFLVLDTAKEIAKNREREFVEWNNLNEKEKLKLFENPEKYFVFCDIRLSSYDVSDLRGLPIFTDNKKAIEFKIPLWALYMEQKKADGLIFFDEISLSPPLVQSSVYKILYDRQVNESKISDNFLIMGASNLDDERAYVHTLAPPLKDRCGEIELKGSSIENFSEYLIKRKIDSRIIGFLNFKSSNLYKVDFEDNQKYTAYRGWCERVNPLIKDVRMSFWKSVL
jgi:MoxR-like ATPase